MFNIVRWSYHHVDHRIKAYLNYELINQLWNRSLRLISMFPTTTPALVSTFQSDLCHRGRWSITCQAYTSYGNKYNRDSLLRGLVRAVLWYLTRGSHVDAWFDVEMLQDLLEYHNIARWLKSHACQKANASNEASVSVGPDHISRL